MRKVVRFLDSIYPFLAVVLFIAIGGFFVKIDSQLIILLFIGNLIIFSPIILPSLFLFFNYLKNDDKGKIILRDGKLYYQTKEKVELLQYVLLVFRNVKNDQYFSFLPWDSYYYYEIEMEDGEKKIVTCFSMKKAFFQSYQFGTFNSKYPRIGSHNKKQKQKKNDNNKPNFLDKKLF